MLPRHPFLPSLAVACLCAALAACGESSSSTAPDPAPEKISPLVRWETRLGDRERLLQRIESWKGPTPEATAAAASQRLAAAQGEKAQRRCSGELLEAAASFRQLAGLPETGDREVCRADARALLDVLLATLPAGLEVTEEGGRQPGNLLLRDATWAYALRHQITGDHEDFLRARALLLAFSQKMGSWPVLMQRTGQRWVPQDTPGLAEKDSAGLWNRWIHLDLMEGYPLLHAYTALAPQLSKEERQRIVSGIFDRQVAFISRWKPGIYNTIVYRIDGLVHFGLALGRPEWVHEAVDYLRELRLLGFSPDGFWHEGTPAYHQQVAGRINAIARRLDGYGDPPGWTHPATGERFDDLHLQRELALHQERTESAWRKLTLPNGKVAAVNDADPDRYIGPAKTVSGPELLGTSGYAILGSGNGEDQQQLFLNYKGTFGHEHLDVNGFHAFALGRRWFDETRYRPLPGSGSSREWSMSTAAHNTVVIDETDQARRFVDGRMPGREDAAGKLASRPYRGHHNGSNHLGDLLLFDGRQEAVQVVEVEGSKAYSPAPERYRRTLVKVALEAGEGYIVDLFRVKGGKVHDYLLHGPLAEPYTVSAAAPLEPAEGGLHRFIQLRHRAPATLPWEWTLTTGDGASSRSIVLAPAGAIFFVGEAPAINRIGTAPWVNLRHEVREAGESTFVVVHELRRKGGRITSARLLTRPGDTQVAVEVCLGERTDVILSTLSEGESVSATTSDGRAVSLKGRLAYLKKEKGQAPAATLWDGTKLSLNGREIVSSPHAALHAVVARTLSREGGDPWDALVTPASLPDDGSLAGAMVRVDLGGKIVWSYRIAEIRRKGGETHLLLEHDPGFSVDASGVKMRFHPGWGFPGKAALTLPVTSRSYP
ncbi:MAG TPA: heparinase II/III family protein [Chthoniobacteraceae bacterium]|nr:heparinase II/III family protein [Chthoniobacteraceae bacterium]